MDKAQRDAGYSKKEIGLEVSMKTQEAPRSTGRPAPSERERKIAARIRVNADRARKVDTPKWIRKLAETS